MAFWKRNPFGESWLVRTTVSHRADAERLARTLIERRLAACVHIVEIGSVYRWEGSVRQETEYLVEARTTGSRRWKVSGEMLANHPYKTPLVEHVHGNVNRAYATWMADEVA